MIITIGVARIFFGLKGANGKLPKASLDAVDILKLTGAICGGVLVKDYASINNGSTSDTMIRGVFVCRIIDINLIKN